MPYYNDNDRKPRVYFSISDGCFRHKISPDQIETCNYISGILTHVSQQQQTFNDGVVNFVNFTFSDDNNDLIVSFNRDKGTYRSVINTLASLDDLRNVDIELGIYKDRNSGYNRITVKANGQKITWLYSAAEIPAVEKFTHNGRQFDDASKRDTFFEYLLQKVSNAIKGEPTQKPDWLPDPAPAKAAAPAAGDARPQRVHQNQSPAQPAYRQQNPPQQPAYQQPYQGKPAGASPYSQPAGQPAGRGMNPQEPDYNYDNIPGPTASDYANYNF